MLRSGKKWKDVFIIFFAVFFILAFFNKYLSGKYLFFETDEAASDLLDFYYPQRDFLAQHLKELKLPLWSPYSQNGFPFLAEGQTGIFFPLNTLLFLLLNTPLAFNWSIILSYPIAFIGMYFYLKKLKLARLSCFFGSFILIFSAYFMTHLKHIPIIQSAAFLPWIFWAIEIHIENSSKKSVGLLAILIALALLPGHLPTFYSMLLISVLYFIFRISKKFKEKGESVSPVLTFFLAIVLGFLLTAIQLIPTAEMWPYSSRNTPITTAAAGIPIDQLITYFSPFHFGNPGNASFITARPNFWENSGYAGIIPLFLFFWLFFFAKKKDSEKNLIYSIIVIFSVCLVISLRQPQGLFNNLWDFIPGLSFTREPGRFLLFVDFGFAALSAVALNKILTTQNHFASPVAYTLVILTIFDLTWTYYAYPGKMEAKLWTKIPPVVSFLQNDPDNFRIVNYSQEVTYAKTYTHAGGWLGNSKPYLASKNNLPPTLNTLFKVKDINFQYDYAGSFSLNKNALLTLSTKDELLGQINATKILGMENVKYVIGFEDLPPQATQSGMFKKLNNIKIFVDFPPLQIWQNTDFLPRAYLVHKETVVDHNSIFDYINSDKFSPKDEVILEKDIKLPDHDNKLNIADSVKITKDTETQVDIQVKTKNYAYLVLSDSYYPGWQAQVDSKRTEILRANFAFRAVVIPPGEHLVTFTFKPKSLYFGAGLSAVAAIVLVILFII